MKQKVERATVIFVLSTIAMFSACHKAQVASAVPPPPPPAAPTASLTASPQAVEKGQSTTLTWETTNASEVSVDAEGLTTETLGLLQPNGTMAVTPSDSATYTLYAKGPGGKESASVRVTVTLPAPPPPVPSGPSEDELFAQNVNDIYFDFDQSEIRPDQQSTILWDALFLTEYPNLSFTIEGHCDERGSVEYNIALGDKRANNMKTALVAAGVSPANIKTISYGKEAPFCTWHDESCWQLNRRDHFIR